MVVMDAQAAGSQHLTSLPEGSSSTLTSPSAGDEVAVGSASPSERGWYDATSSSNQPDTSGEDVASAVVAAGGDPSSAVPAFSAYFSQMAGMYAANGKKPFQANNIFSGKPLTIFSALSKIGQVSSFLPEF